MRLKIAAGNGDDRFRSKFQSWSHKRKFQNRLIFRIIQKQIGNFKGTYIHNARYTESLALVAGTAKILYGGKHTAF